MNQKNFELSVNDTCQRYVVPQNAEVYENQQFEQDEPIYEHCMQRNNEAVNQDQRVFTSTNGKF